MPAEGGAGGMHAAFLDFDSLGPADLDCSALHAALPGIRLYSHTDPAQLSERLAGCGIVLLNKTRLDADALTAAPSLRLICLAATGTDNVDLEAAAARGIAVYNIRDYCTPAVAQHVFALILHLNQQLGSWQQQLAAGKWQQSRHFCLLQPPFHELAGRTLGIIGLGQLGSAVARLGQAFGMEVIAARRSTAAAAATGPDFVRRVPLATVLAEAHVLSLHCPLTAATTGLINEATLTRMRRDALLINTARGGLVDSTALLRALKTGRIGGAGIDVLAEEPPPADEPLLAASLPNLLITPHIAWAAREARQRALLQLVDNVSDWRAGRRGRRVV